MNVEHDPQADAVYIRFRESDIASTEKLDEQTLIDRAADGTITGIELLNISGRAEVQQASSTSAERKKSVQG